VRIILFTGKGGVGKTTVAAATAAVCAAAGHRTTVMSTDPAHSLGDAFDIELADELTEVAPRLWARQLDAQSRMEESWGEIRAYLTSVFDWAGLDDIEAEELAVIPGLDEIFALGDIKDVAASGDSDVLVVDCAPTAETIRLLSLPDILSWYMDRLFPVGRKVTRLVGPVVSRITAGLPVAGDEVFGATERFYRRLEGVKDLLTDAETASVRLVVNPERMVVAEARRTHTYLSLFGYRVDAVIVNRMLPEAVCDPWFETWRATQEAHLAAIEEGFAPTPILPVELAPAEIIGTDQLAEFGRRVYGDLEPASVLFEAEPFRIWTRGDEVVLSVEIPFASRDQVDVVASGGELYLTVGPYRRSVVLPDSLCRREVRHAAFAEGVLHVTFGQN
jgi:arsenite-transporting ATPase